MKTLRESITNEIQCKACGNWTAQKTVFKKWFGQEDYEWEHDTCFHCDYDLPVVGEEELKVFMNLHEDDTVINRELVELTYKRLG